MIKKFAISLTLALVPLTLLSATPQADPIVAELYGKPIKISEVTPAKGYVEGTKKPGTPYEEALKVAQADFLESRIFRALLEDFTMQQKITISDSEVSTFIKATELDAETEKSFALPEDAKREVAKESIRTWKLSKALYEKYGGTVIFQQANPVEPVGAYRMLILESETKGIFKVVDVGMRSAMWHYFMREDHPGQIPKDKVDYSEPWWMQSLKE